MKFSVKSIFGLSLLVFGSFAKADSLAQIISLEGNKAFPVEQVNVRYWRHCSQILSQAWAQRQSPSQVSIGVTLKQNSDQCFFHEPIWSQESVILSVYAEMPTNYVPLASSDTGDLLSGVSIDNFD